MMFTIITPQRRIIEIIVIISRVEALGVLAYLLGQFEYNYFHTLIELLMIWEVLGASLSITIICDYSHFSLTTKINQEWTLNKDRYVWSMCLALFSISTYEFTEVLSLEA